MSNVGHIPAVQFTLGRLAAMEATLEELIMGQINCGEVQVPGYLTCQPALCVCRPSLVRNSHADICDTVRELMSARAYSKCRPMRRS